MNLFHLALGILGGGGLITVAAAALAPAAVLPLLKLGFSGFVSAAASAAKFAIAHWQVTLVTLAVGVSVLFGLLEMGEARHQTKLASSANQELGLVQTATREAAHNPGLQQAAVRPQIAALGRGLDTLRAELDRANASVRAGAALDAQHQAQAAARMKQLEAGDAARRNIIDRLKADAAKPQPGPPCEATATQKEIWP